MTQFRHQGAGPGSAPTLAPPAVPLRPPDQVMRLARLGCFHQTRLSFLRVLLRRIDAEGWRFNRPVFQIDANGVGHAVYALERQGRAYSLVCFAHDLAPEKRSDRVIAEAWDATYALFDGVPTQADIARLQANVPRQEAGRYLASELVLARSNKSVRLFEAVVAALADGRQPDAVDIEATGYLMRTTAVYGNGKFGIADRDVYAGREELGGPFQAEMLSVWLIRAFTVDLAEHLAICRGGAHAARLAAALRRRIGVGNATGLGMAPFLVRHPALIHHWILARETALARVRALTGAAPGEAELLSQRLTQALALLAGWATDDPVQAPRIPILIADLRRLEREAVPACLGHAHPWDALYRWAEAHLGIEAQEQLVALLIEIHGALVDDLAAGMTADETAVFPIDGGMPRATLLHAIDQHYAWAQAIDFAQADANHRFWYVSEEKLEPRLGDRHAEPGANLELPLAIARDVCDLAAALRRSTAPDAGVFLQRSPEHRGTVRRIQITMRHPYAEVRDNLIGQELRAIDLLRCKLSFFGCTRFDPRSDKWLRITLYQGAPFPDDIGRADFDSWIWGEERLPQ